MTLSDKLKRLPKKLDGFTLQMGFTKLGKDEVFYCGYLKPWHFTSEEDSVTKEAFVSYNCHKATYYSHIGIEQAVDLVYDWCEDNNKLV